MDPEGGEQQRRCRGIIALLLLASWEVGYAVGGAGVAAPHWFYVPIAVAASRFGYRGAAVASLAAAALGGPLLPLDVAAGVVQAPSDWVTRGAFFVALGQFLAWLITRHDRAQRDLQTTRQNVSVLQGLLERQNGAPGAARGEVQRLKELLAAGGPDVVFQPVVDLRNGRVQGVEALARFNVQPKQDPGFWFDLAWKTGLGLELELTALRGALRQAALAAWSLRGREPLAGGGCLGRVPPAPSLGPSAGPQVNSRPWDSRDPPGRTKSSPRSTVGTSSSSR